MIRVSSPGRLIHLWRSLSCITGRQGTGLQTQDHTLTVVLDGGGAYFRGWLELSQTSFARYFEGVHRHHPT